MIWIGRWNEEAKETTEKWLELANAAIAAALAAFEDGDYAKACEQIRNAIFDKHEAVQAFPPVLVSDTGHHVEFDKLYDALFEADELAQSAESWIVSTISDAPRSVRDLIDELKQARERLKQLRLSDPLFADDDCVQLFDNLISEIDSLIKALEEFTSAKDFDFHRLQLLVQALKAAKKALLDNLSLGYGISLWDCYVLFYEIDDRLLEALRGMEGLFAQDAPKNARGKRAVGQQLEYAEAVKRKLEAFIAGNPAPAEPPHGKNDDAPPEPKYPQGSEDLPPFPPNLG